MLPHGNSDVERGISVNSRMLTNERNKLSEVTINGLRATKDMIKFSDPQLHRPERFPVTKKLLNSVRSAHSAYRQKCEEEREEEERKKKKKRKRRGRLCIACVADSCKHPCTQSAQRLQFACSNFHENKKPFLINYIGLV